MNTANNQRHYQVSKTDLPVSCPMPDMPVWNSHPKVYLPLPARDSATCPYCGATFTLVETDSAN